MATNNEEKPMQNIKLPILTPAQKVLSVALQTLLAACKANDLDIRFAARMEPPYDLHIAICKRDTNGGAK